MEFSLDQIKQILSSSTYNRLEALQQQKELFRIKKKRIDHLIATIDTTVQMIQKGEPMQTNVAFGPFVDPTYNQYKDEAKAKWGHTDAYTQSMERLKALTPAQWQTIKQEGSDIVKELANTMDNGIEDQVVQELIARYHVHMNRFYDCSYEMFENLGQMYVQDQRFTSFYEKVKPGLAVFVRDAITLYCTLHNNDK